MVVEVPEFLPNRSDELSPELERLIDGNDQVRSIMLGDRIQRLGDGEIFFKRMMDLLIVLELTRGRLYILQKGSGRLIDPNNVVKEFRYECHRRREAVGC